MSPIDQDADLLRKQKVFLQQVEFELRHINREVIHGHIPDLNRESFFRLAKFVAGLRSHYLEVALAVSQTEPGSAEAEAQMIALGKARRQFDEARDSFAALERAIEQGYVDIKA